VVFAFQNGAKTYKRDRLLENPLSLYTIMKRETNSGTQQVKKRPRLALF
jgi:hypothetical protein